MLTADDPDALVRGVILSPEEDAPRLVYADWLEEHGGEVECGRCLGKLGHICLGNERRATPANAMTHACYLRESGEAYRQTEQTTWRPCCACSGTGRVSDGLRERAEFIRVQCRIAELEREQTNRLNDETDWSACTGVSASWCPNCGDCCCRNPEESRSDSDCPLHAEGSPHACLEMIPVRLESHRRREQELFKLIDNGLIAELGPAWVFPAYSCQIRCEQHQASTYEVVYTYRRGFVDSISCPLSAFLGGECGRCDGQGRIEKPPRLRQGYSTQGIMIDCPDCHGKGHTPSIATALFDREPVTAVRLTDREPYPGLSWYGWYNAARPGTHSVPESAILPTELFALLTGYLASVQESRYKAYLSLAAAQAALSTAALALCRSRVPWLKCD